MGKRADNSGRGVMLTAAAVRRIGRAVQAYEHGDRSLKPIKFRTAFDDSELVRICKTSAKWTKNTTSSLDVWEAGDPTAPAASDPPITIDDVINIFRDVDEGVFVVIAKAANGRWYLVEAGNPEPVDDSSGECTKPVIAGQDLSQLLGYDESAVQLLGHEYGCLRWLSTTDCGSGSS